MADPARARKLAVRIRQIVSAAIETQIKDPRLGMVTVTDARVTSDLREATVFYTVYGDAEAGRRLGEGPRQRHRGAAVHGGQADRHQVRAHAHLRRRRRPRHRPGARRGPGAGTHADAELARVREGAQLRGRAPTPTASRPRTTTDDDADDERRRTDGAGGPDDADD